MHSTVADLHGPDSRAQPRLEMIERRRPAASAARMKPNTSHAHTHKHTHKQTQARTTARSARGRDSTQFARSLCSEHTMHEQSSDVTAPNRARSLAVLILERAHTPASYARSWSMAADFIMSSAQCAAAVGRTCQRCAAETVDSRLTQSTCTQRSKQPHAGNSGRRVHSKVRRAPVTALGLHVIPDQAGA